MLIYDELLFMTNEYKCILNNTKKDDVIIFGSGEFGRKLYFDLREYADANVVAFCDNAEYMQGMTVLGLSVFSPKDSISCFSDALYMITPKGYMDEIEKQLRELGVKQSRIIKVDVGNRFS